MNSAQTGRRFLADNPLWWFAHDEQCEACDEVTERYSHLDDLCPFHRGQADGIERMARVVAAVAADPEIGAAVDELIAEHPDLRLGGGR